MCIAPLTAYAQEKYSNRTLHDIAEQLHELDIDNLDTSEIIIERICPKRHIIIERGADGVINHIGFKLFDRAIMDHHSTPLYYFLERYFLSLILLEDDVDIYTRLKMDRVKITSEIYPEVPLKKGLQKIISDNTAHSSIHITNNGKEYTISCFNNDKLYFQITFPVRYELISGYTKIEAERRFYPLLLSFMGSDKRDETINLSEYDLEAYKDSILCTPQDTYILIDMISTSYYKKVNDQYTAIFDARYMAEGLYNLFNATHNQNITVEVTQSLYGENNKLNYEVPLNELTHYLRSQDCQLYTGLKKSSENEINMTVMAVNHELGYQHLLICSTDKRILSNPESHNVKVKIYCHIPTHNITSLLSN